MRVLIVDDHTMFTESLARLLVSRGAVTEVVVADGLAALTAALPQLRCDLAVVDWRLGDGRGPDVINLLRSHRPGTRTILLSGVLRPAMVRRAVELGCEGVITKDRAADELLDAIARVADGGTAMSTTALAMLDHVSSDGAELSERELQVVDAIARGLSNQEIADELFLSVNTVRNHIQRISSRLEARSRLEVAMVALRHGWIDLPPVGPVGASRTTSSIRSTNSSTA